MVENAFDSVSGDSTELCTVKDTFQGADTLESPAEESALMENEVSQDLMENDNSENMKTFKISVLRLKSMQKRRHTLSLMKLRGLMTLLWRD